MYKILGANMGFGAAFESVKRSVIESGMRLPEWSQEEVVRIQYPDRCSSFETYLYYTDRCGRFDNWMPTNEELFNENWEFVEI